MEFDRSWAEGMLQRGYSQLLGDFLHSIGLGMRPALTPISRQQSAHAVRLVFEPHVRQEAGNVVFLEKARSTAAKQEQSSRYAAVTCFVHAGDEIWTRVREYCAGGRDRTD